MKNKVDLIIYPLLIVLFVGLIYLGFITYRWFNWKFSYESKVETLIETKVKNECLKR